MRNFVDIKDLKRFVIFASIAVVLLALDLASYFKLLVPYKPLKELVSLTNEDGIGDWFCATLWLLSAIVLFAQASLTKAKDEKIGWAILGGFFSYLAFDDGVRFHERMGTSVRYFFEDLFRDPLIFEFFPSYSWQIVFAPILIGFAIFMLWFLNRNLPKKHKALVVASFALLGFAVLMDFFEGLNLEGWTARSTVHMLRAVEESIEVMGASLLLLAFISSFESKQKKFLRLVRDIHHPSKRSKSSTKSSSKKRISSVKKKSVSPKRKISRKKKAA